MIPSQYINAQTILHYTSSIPTGDRTPNINAQKGLLKEITYPTKGKDTYYYELNSYTKDEQQITYASKAYADAASTGYKTGFSTNLTVPFAQEATFNIAYYYQGNEALEDNAGENYYIQYQVWNMTTNTAVTAISTLTWNEDPELENAGLLLTLQPNINYAVKYSIYGVQSSIDLVFKYKSAINNVTVEKDYYGMRLPKIISDLLSNGQATVKKYKYKEFSTNNNLLTYGPKTAAFIVDMGTDGGKRRSRSNRFRICRRNN